MQTTKNPPKCPTGDGIAEFLKDWSDRKFEKLVKGRKVEETRFGLPRATTLLHFISVGRFPIFDSFVGIAMRRLCLPLPQNPTVPQYLKEFCSLFSAIAA